MCCVTSRQIAVTAGSGLAGAGTAAGNGAGSVSRDTLAMADAAAPWQAAGAGLDRTAWFAMATGQGPVKTGARLFRTGISACNLSVRICRDRSAVREGAAPGQRAGLADECCAALLGIGATQRSIDTGSGFAGAIPLTGNRTVLICERIFPVQQAPAPGQGATGVKLGCHA